MPRTEEDKGKKGEDKNTKEESTLGKKEDGE